MGLGASDFFINGNGFSLIFFRAQVLLIQAIEDMSFQTKKSLKVRRIKCTQKVSLPKVSLLTQHSDWFLSNSLGAVFPNLKRKL